MSFALHTNTELIINTSWYNSRQNGKKGLTKRTPEIFYFKNIFDSFNHKEDLFPNLLIKSLAISNRFQNKFCLINNLEFPYSSRKNYILTDAFESTKFFPDPYLVTNLLNLPNETDLDLIKLSSRLESLKPIVIHLRAGDHLNFPGIYKTSNLEFYEQGINLIFKNHGERPIWLITDDINYSLDLFKNINIDFVVNFPMHTNSVQMLNFGSKIKYFIGSESNFSWWLYYFANREKALSQAVLPKGKYFDEINQNFDSPNLELI